MAWVALEAEIAAEMREFADAERDRVERVWLELALARADELHKKQAHYNQWRMKAIPGVREHYNAWRSEHRRKQREAAGIVHRAYRCGKCGVNGHSARSCRGAT